jgi:hypothetical protein
LGARCGGTANREDVLFAESWSQPVAGISATIFAALLVSEDE